MRTYGIKINNYSRYTVSNNWLAYIDYHQGNLFEAEKRYKENLAICRGELTLPNKGAEGLVYHNRARIQLILRQMSFVYVRMERCSDALNSISTIEEMQRIDPTAVWRQHLVLMAKGFVFAKCGKQQEGIEYLEQAIEVLGIKGREEELSEARLLLAEVLEKTDSERALDLLKESLEYAEKTKYFVRADLYFLLAKILYSKEKTDKAIELLVESNREYKRMGMLPREEVTETLISEWRKVT